MNISHITSFLDLTDNPSSFFEGFFENTTTGLRIFDVAGQTVMVNKAFSNLFGGNCSHPYNILNEKLSAEIYGKGIVARAFSGEKVHLPLTWYPTNLCSGDQSKSDKLLALQITFFPITNTQGKVTHVCQMYTDHTEVENHLAQERDLRLISSIQKSYCDTLLQSPFIGVVVAGEGGEIFESNQAFLDIVGYDQNDVKSGALDWRKLTPIEHQHTAIKALRELQETGSAKPFEKEYIRKDGSRVRVLIGVTRVKNVEDRAVTFILDLTEIQSIKSNLEHSLKAATLGQFTSEIVHDFNNVLGAVLLTSDLMLTGELTAKAKHEAEVIQKTVQRATALTKHLLAFSRGQKEQVEKVQLDKAVNDMLPILQRLIGKKCQLVTRFQSEIDTTTINLTQLEQILWNLTVNARDACSQQGNILIEIGNVNLPNGLSGARNLSVPPGKYIKLSVQDSGCGIDEKIKDKIFSPYFTTKAAGSGTGLGLSTILGIVEQIHGTVTVDSEVGVGTSFNIYFQAADVSLEVSCA
ncbi:MAG: PAS domain-containing sensor histidine kinase [Pseudobdellovibrio sp.]